MSKHESIHFQQNASACAHYLTEILSKLGDVYSIAENALHEIPVYTLTQLRACGKIISAEILRRNGHQSNGNESFHSMLDNQIFHSHDLKKVRSDLHQIRKVGNRAAHPEQEQGPFTFTEATVLAKSALETIFRIAITTLSNDETTPPPFKLPTTEHSNRMCGDAILRKVPKAQYMLGLREKRRVNELFERQKTITDIFERHEFNLEYSTAIKDASFWLEKAALDERIPKAKYELACLHFDSLMINQDYNQGLRELYRAADLGVPEACAMLGNFALNGKIFNSWGRELGDFEADGEVKEWLEFAANHGIPSALNSLVYMYQEGKYVTKDSTRALQYAQAAADAGYPLAKRNLARIYLNQNEEPRTVGEAAKLLQEAAEAGINIAYFDLYEVYSKGFGVDASQSIADFYLLKGCEANEPHALLLWVKQSRRKNFADREIRHEVCYLLRIIDRPNIESELLEPAQELLPKCVEDLRDKVRAIYSRLGGNYVFERENLIMLFTTISEAIAEPVAEDQRLGPFGWAEYRSKSTFEIFTAFVNLLNPSIQSQEKRKSYDYLNSIVPDFAPFLEPPKRMRKTRPNERCRCGSGKKHKKCCGQ